MVAALNFLTPKLASSPKVSSSSDDKNHLTIRDFNSLPAVGLLLTENDRVDDIFSTSATALDLFTRDGNRRNKEERGTVRWPTLAYCSLVYHSCVPKHL